MLFCFVKQKSIDIFILVYINNIVELLYVNYVQKDKHSSGFEFYINQVNNSGDCSEVKCAKRQSNRYSRFF